MSDQERSPVCKSPDCRAPPPQLQLFQTVLFAAPVVFAFLILVLFCMIYFRRNSRASIHAQMRARILARQFLSSTLNRVLANHSGKNYQSLLSMKNMLPHMQTLISLFFCIFEAQLYVGLLSERTSATSVYCVFRCAVCLGDYQLNEKLQQLPECKHSFHVECIDEWLSRNTTCPICRTSLLRQEAADPVNSIEQPETSQVELLRRDYNEQWEERVIAQGFSFHTQTDAFNGSNCTSSESAIQISGGH